MATSESITGMPDLGGQVPGIPNDTGLGGSHHSSRESVRVPLTPEERLIAIERTRIERDTLAAVLEEQCDELANYVINRGSRSIVNHLNVGLGRRMDQLRQAHLDHNKALHDNNDPFDNPYAYIIGFEIRARDLQRLLQSWPAKLVFEFSIQHMPTCHATSLTDKQLH
ncbi:hypothetical protein DAPPUDRAFT_333272 [Daphnia pulex]|uniref:Uncharacterized protein n=1 Tax=Daphnia pulex TaxID=6669 RepID=E9HSE0_DAPPU|nr:hypothetical protein DAPPUDRAFT_333272 [Daphnia pulex]|eukprot:EFX65328.1 hypothetical protein DAPPUDRAFT_333272 [Daphnia pulex]